MTRTTRRTPRQAQRPRDTPSKASPAGQEAPIVRAEVVARPALRRELNSRGARGVPAVTASVAMAGHYLAVVEAHRRVQVALEYGPEALAGRVADPEEPPDWNRSLQSAAGRSDRIRGIVGRGLMLPRVVA